MTAGPSVTITRADIDATTGNLDLAFTATYDLGGGVTRTVPISQVIPSYQVAWFLALVKQIVLPAQYAVPNSAAPTNSDVARLSAICVAIFQATPDLVPPTPPTVLTPPAFTLTTS